MKLFSPRKKRRDSHKRPKHTRLQMEELEPRALLSASTFPQAGFSIPGIPNIPGIPSFPGIPGIPSNLPNLLANLNISIPFTNPQYSDQWYLKNTGQTLSTNPNGPATGTPGADIKAEDAWTLNAGNHNVVIAIFDTGVDLENEDILPNIWTNPGEIADNGIDDDGNGFVDDVHGWNFVDNNNDVQDTSETNHGTTTSGVLASIGGNDLGITGVDGNVTLLPVKIGTDEGVSDGRLIAAINYINALKKSGVPVVAINASYLSFSAPGMSALKAIKTAGDNGMLYISAAGNSGINWDSFFLGSFLPSNMLLVAATDNQDQLASFSNFGKNSVALAAPGVDILTTMRGGLYVPLSGTSYAGPMVSGAIALMKSYVPTATMAQIKSALLGGVDKLSNLTNKVTSGGRLNIFKSMQLVLGKQPPTGEVETLNGDVISGWAFDANAGAEPAMVKIVIDGVTVATIPAGDAHDGLEQLGSSNHGFTFELPDSLAGGKHTVKVYALDSVSSGTPGLPVLLGQGTVVTQGPPVGLINSVKDDVVTGWAIDKDDALNAVNVVLKIDGETVDEGVADVVRKDLTKSLGSANHGFSFTLPALEPGLHRVDVFAIDTTTEESVLIGSKTINTNRAATGALSTFNGSTFTGWAFDPDAGEDSIEIVYKLDNNDAVRATADGERTDLVEKLGSANHGFSVTLPQLMAGSHKITVWTVDSTTGELKLIKSLSKTVSGSALPKGAVEVLTSTQVSGWVKDVNLLGESSFVRIDVDGEEGEAFLADMSRPELLKKTGAGNFGFSKDLDLSPGRHRIDVYAIDNPTEMPVLLASKIVGVQDAQGAVEELNAESISGWAYLPGLHDDETALVRIDIDNIPALLAEAHDDHDELPDAVEGSAHGFSLSLPKLAPGTHSVTVKIVDPWTLAVTGLTTMTLITD